ncbi:HMG box-containing protein 1-like isoform X2 [Actinia tenebrosa]|uniref:HMG box-containing protein 1 n=1 Tax=Actinia tenebrosa TaxID=6105 RepID=A0A6P8I1Z9_ACTTE|nr:HMG box-containing protein 1-like isoform X2 [Actinia tenebrosa]
MKPFCTKQFLRTNKAKSVPPALDLTKNEDSFSQGILAEFAFIATGPQSPLVQEVSGYDNESPCDPMDIDYNIPSVESDISTTSPPLDPQWYRYATPPPTAWSCFLEGTRIQTEGQKEWKYAEDLGNEDIPHVCHPSDGLRLMSYERLVQVVDDEKEYVASFHSTSADQPSLRAEVSGDHPFFVKYKGWCSFNPDRTLTKYGILCQNLTPNDVCLPSSHPDVMKAIRIGRSSNMFDFTYSDSNAVLTLSSMIKDCQEHRSRRTKLGLFSAKSRVPKTPSQIQQLNKRPMNAFMLFAKRFRVEITQAHPGKDNRAISVILGDKWKSMDEDDREQYVQEAKQLAEEHKKFNPDCWKRKRSGTQGRTKSSSLKRKRL